MTTFQPDALGAYSGREGVLGNLYGAAQDVAGAAGAGHHATTRTPEAFRVGSRGDTVEVEPSPEPPDVAASPSARVNVARSDGPRT